MKAYGKCVMKKDFPLRWYNCTDMAVYRGGSQYTVDSHAGDH